MDASRVSGDPLQAGSVSYTSTTSNPFEFLWTPGFSSFNGGLISYLQVASVFAMALVAILALLRLRRGGSQRSILSVVITGAVTAYLSYTWAHVASTPADPAAMVIEAYHFTPSLVVATVAALAATVGAVMATVRIESTDSAA